MRGIVTIYISYEQPIDLLTYFLDNEIKKYQIFSFINLIGELFKFRKEN